MASLKEVRISLGLTQGEVAQRTGITMSAICNYESGNITPPLEDMIILEKEYGRKIEWKDSIPPEVMKSINVLFRNYPVRAVTSFLARNLKKDIIYGMKLINHYAQVADVLEIEPLMPPNP